jgi:hypothetical protein
VVGISGRLEFYWNTFKRAPCFCQLVILTSKCLNVFPQKFFCNFLLFYFHTTYSCEAVNAHFWGWRLNEKKKLKENKRKWIRSRRKKEGWRREKKIIRTDGMGRRRKNNSAFIMSSWVFLAHKSSNYTDTNFFTGACKVAFRSNLSLPIKTRLLLLLWTQFKFRYRFLWYSLMF